jgi:prevent-host-death family protein
MAKPVSGGKHQVRVEVTADEARDTLGAILDRAGFQGERLTITRHGRQLAALVSIGDLEKLESLDDEQPASAAVA